MTRRPAYVVAALFLASCAAMPAQVSAADGLNILIMGEDADADTVPRSNRVFTRVLNELSNQLHDAGYTVFDEAAVSIDGFAQGRERRTDSELMEILQALDSPPIDLAILFQIYPRAQQRTSHTMIDTRVAGRLLVVGSGQRIGNFEQTPPQPWAAALDCDRECMLAVVGDHAKVLAQDVGATLAIKIAAMACEPDATVASLDEAVQRLPDFYRMTFNNFTPDEVTTIEDYLVEFRGYRQHRPIRSTLRFAEYSYETCSEDTRLNRNLRRTMEALGVDASVAFAASTNVFAVEKITTPGLD